MRGKRHHVMLASCSGVHGDARAAIQNVHFASQFAHPHVLSDVLPRHRIAAPLPVDIGIPRHFTQLTIDVGIAGATCDGLQAELLYVPTHRDLFAGGPMHTLIRHCRDPLAQLCIHVRETMWFASL